MMKVQNISRQLFCCRPRLYIAGFVVSIMFESMPLVIGLILRSFFDSLTGAAPAGLAPMAIIGALLAAEALRLGTVSGGFYLWASLSVALRSLMRQNLLDWLARGPGARCLPAGTGDIVNRFREDVDEVYQFLEGLIDLGSGLVFASLALIVLFWVDPLITLLVFVPLLIIVTAVNALGSRIARYRQASRAASGQVSSFIGELFGAVQTIKVRGAEERAVAHLARLNQERARLSIRDRSFSAGIEAFNANIANLSLGLVLLLAAGQLRSGSFSVGDVVLFVAYLPWLADFPHWIGRILTSLRQSQVSLDRLEALLVDAPPSQLTAPYDVFAATASPPRQLHTRSEQCSKPVALIDAAPAYSPDGNGKHDTQVAGGAMHAPASRALLEVRGLSYSYSGTQRGIADMSFTLHAGSRTIIVGRVGSGKSTLLRVILGLLPRDAGAVFWNGKLIADPASFLVPPRSAYVAQIPTLFSNSLADNILLGMPGGVAELRMASHSAVLEHDLANMPDSFATLVGPRGMRLSGGQIQRVAAARAFVRQPELLVLDDLSSALDIETEQQIWQRLPAGSSVLAVTQRRMALRHADQVLVLRDGHLIDSGSPVELLERSVEVRAIMEAGSLADGSGSGARIVS